MSYPPKEQGSSLAPKLTAPQHKPRPLPLFLDLLRSETAGDPTQMDQALRGLRRYQEAQRCVMPQVMPAIAEAHGATLRDYGGKGRDLLFVPSLINPPNVLDLTVERSMLRWLAQRDHRVLLLDWGRDPIQRADLSVGGHVEQVIVPLLRQLAEPPSLVGYCLGGTMAIAAACLTPVRRLVTLAAPWRFSGFSDEATAMLARLWQSASQSVAALNLLPMEVLQAVFWNLDPKRTVAKFAEFADLPPGGTQERAFVTLEDWANDGPPLPAAAARELFEDFFGADVTGNGRWTVGGKIIDPALLPCPHLHVISTTDRIVPEATAVQAGERLALAQGHVGMIVGSRADRCLWKPLDSWLSHCSIE